MLHPARIESMSVTDRFPNTQDWAALQGGLPRVFYNPQKPETERWVVLHVYDEYNEPGLRFQNGSVLSTEPPKKGQVDFSDFIIRDPYTSGSYASRTIRVPTMMVYARHGEPCRNRSGGGARGSYEKIKSQVDYERYITELGGVGMWELVYALAANQKLMLNPCRIRQPRPLRKTV